MRAGRRLRRLELAALQRFFAMMTRRDCEYYQRLLDRIIEHGLESVSAEHRERAAVIHLLFTGEHLCD